MLKSEIFMAIDNVSNEKYNAMDDVNMAILNYYEKQQTVMEYYDDISDDVSLNDGIIMEAASKKKKSNKNILQTIWDAIKQFFKMLAEQFGRLIDRIRNHKTSTSDGKFVSCDSVVLRVLSRSKYNTPDNTSEWRIPQINPAYLKDNKYSTDKEVEKFEKKLAKKNKKDNKVVMEAAEDVKYITVNIPAGNGSTFYPKTVKVPKSDIIAEINNDDKSISFHIVGFGKWNQTEVTGGDNEASTNIKGTKKAWTHSSRISLYLISEPKAFEHFISLTDDATEILFDNKKSHISSFNKKCKKIIDDINHGAKHKKLEKVKVSLKDLTEFQKKVNTLNYKLDRFANVNTNVSDFDKETINSFNMLSKKLLDIQVSMNLLSSSLTNNLIVNQHFIGCIKSLALLDQFVATLIDEGMPPKYIAYNTWLVANECIKGKDKEGYHPIWGQTRFIFFPPGGKFVYKIAMCGAGITSNKAEIRTSDMFVKMDRVDLIAPVVKTWEKNSIVVMEKIDNKTAPSYPEILAYTKRVNDAIAKYEKDHKIHLNIAIADQHKDNVKYDKVNKCYRSIDYGIANRAYVKPDKKK